MGARDLGDFYSPSELFEKYPQVAKFGWTAVKIGVFFHAGLLSGYFSIKERKALIEENSFFELIQFYNQKNSSQGKQISL